MDLFPAGIDIPHRDGIFEPFGLAFEFADRLAELLHLVLGKELVAIKNDTDRDIPPKTFQKPVILSHGGVFGIEPDADVVIDSHLLRDITSECHNRKQHGGHEERICGQQVEYSFEHTGMKLA